MLENNGFFSVKSLMTGLLQQRSMTGGFKGSFIWQLEVPKKVKICLWLMMHERIKTCCRLQKAMPIVCLSLSWCVMCKNNEENQWHLLFDCPFALACWGPFQDFQRELMLPQQCSRSSFTIISRNDF